MEQRGGSVVQRRVLGRELRRLREEAGLTLEAAAPVLDFSVSTLSRIENAQVTVNVHVVRSMLDTYNAPDRWTELIELCRASRKRGWWRNFKLGDMSYVGFEAEALRVQDFTLSWVPGLLQTPDYARALFAAVPLPRSEAQLSDDVEVRMIRQRRLTSADDPLELVTVVDESALCRPVGGREVLRAQLRHLAEAAELESVTLYVLPAEVGAHAALASAFTVLHFGDLGEPDVAYVEHSLGNVMLEREADVERARLAFDRVRSDALDPAESMTLVRRLAGEA
jgi:transcriptional regulator with XRE-family HTH domain